MSKKQTTSFNAAFAASNGYRGVVAKLSNSQQQASQAGRRYLRTVDQATKRANTSSRHRY